MSAQRRRGAAAPNASSAAFRGALLVGVAVLLGAGLLLKSFDTPSTSSGTPSASSSTPTTAPGDTSVTTPTSESVAHNPADVKVLVLNGVDKSKAIAKPGADALKAANFTTLSPGDAAQMVTASAVYYQPGYELDAQAVAARLGIPAAAVQPLPQPLPTSVSDPKDANVVAIIGPDSPIAAASNTAN